MAKRPRQRITHLPTYPAVRALQWIDGTGTFRDTAPGWYPIRPPFACPPVPWDLIGKWPAQAISINEFELEMQ